MADAAHAEQHREIPGHAHGHGGELEMRAHDAGPGGATLAPALATRPASGAIGRWTLSEQGEAIRLGTLYALGHGAVVIALGLAAIAFGALLPDWLDPIMGRIVGVTLVALGVWVMYSVYRYARAGERFRLRSRWMLVFDGDALRLAPIAGADPRPRARRAARDELVRGAHVVRRRDDPRRRRRDRHAGPAHRRGRRRLERRASACRCCSRSCSAC